MNARMVAVRGEDADCGRCSDGCKKMMLTELAVVRISC